jgi:hypothetical protein
LQQDGLRISVLQHRYSLIDKLIHKLGISVALQYAGRDGFAVTGYKTKTAAQRPARNQTI